MSRFPAPLVLTLLALCGLAQASPAQTLDTPTARGRRGAPASVLPPQRAHPAVGAPSGLRVVPSDGLLRMEWSSTFAATSYTLYVGLDANVGPGNAVLVQALGNANRFVVDGLVVGQRYEFTVSATGPAGEGPTAPPVGAVFGPHGPVSVHVVRSAVFPGGESLSVDAQGIVVQLFDLGNPAALPLEGSTGEDGRVRIADVPAGTYQVVWLAAGSVGVLPTPLVVTGAGAVIDPLELAVDPQPEAVLAGTLHLENGMPARLDLDAFGLHERAQVEVLLSGGGSLVTVPDASGAWLIEGLTAADYPLQVTASFGALGAAAAVSTAPLERTRIDLAFPEVVPRVVGLGATQGGVPVSQIESGVPVTFSAEVDNPAALALEPRWIATFNGETLTSTDLEPTFTFTQPPGPPVVPGQPSNELGDALDSGAAIVRYVPSPYSGNSFDVLEMAVANPNPFTVAGVGCWSGSVVSWHPNDPSSFQPGHQSTVTVTHSGPLSPNLATTTATAGGFFEMPLDPNTVPPYLVRVDKLGYMRFLWPFEQKLPLEAQFQVIPAQSFFANSSSPRQIIHPLGAVLTLPSGSLLDPSSTPYFGSIVVEMIVLGKAPNPAMPFPPTPELRASPTFRRAIVPQMAVWLDIRTSPGNVSLTPTSAATLTFPYGPFGFGKPGGIPCYHQRETTGYFERWGYTNESVPSAWLITPGQYRIPLGTKGLFMIGSEQPLQELKLQADRSLNYPFQIRVGTDPFLSGIFPIVVNSALDSSIGKILVPQTVDTTISVLDLRSAPGLHFGDVDSPLWPLEPMKQTRVVSTTVTPAYQIPGPVIPSQVVTLSLSSSEPALSSKLGTISASGHFLSRGGLNTLGAAIDYYQQIQAPLTLLDWRITRGFPARFGDPLTGVAANDYATAYYYNLGDLGFARAQTMRIRDGLDGQKDVAFAVTNYRTLEDARCGRGAIATVCMDYAARYDYQQTSTTRYTRFYVYGGDGNLLVKANLDGAGDKYMPNLCITCHGGSYYQNDSNTQGPNLGARFLPFDLESYTYHPKFGVQRAELAKMNAGVLLTNPTKATKELITGWYGTPQPTLNPLFFDQLHVPSIVDSMFAWVGPVQVDRYTNVFKASCRVCHNSRESSGVQFATHTDFQNFNFGKTSALTSVAMPHSQRTWGIFWGSRCAVNLGQFVADMPTMLSNF